MEAFTVNYVNYPKQAGFDTEFFFGGGVTYHRLHTLGLLEDFFLLVWWGDRLHGCV